MKNTRNIALTVLLIALLLAGCSGAPETGSTSSSDSLTPPETGQPSQAAQSVTYTGVVTDRFTEGSGPDSVEVLALETEDGETVHLTLLEDTALQNRDVVSVGDYVAVESEIHDDSGYHPALVITVLNAPMELSSPNAPYARIRLTLPAGWAAEAREYDPEADGLGEFGFTFWPEEAPELQVRLDCYPLGFGICGTGVTIEDITLPGGQAATTYTEGNEDSFFFTLCYQNAPGDYVASYWGSKALWEQYEDQVLTILGKAELGVEGILSEAEATQLAQDSCTFQYQSAYGRFDVMTGVWTVSFYDGNKTETFQVKADGTLDDMVEAAIID